MTGKERPCRPDKSRGRLREVDPPPSRRCVVTEREAGRQGSYSIVESPRILLETQNDGHFDISGINGSSCSKGAYGFESLHLRRLNNSKSEDLPRQK